MRPWCIGMRRRGAMLLELKQAREYGPGVKSNATFDLPHQVITHRWQDMARDWPEGRESFPTLPPSLMRSLARSLSRASRPL
jgi:hypothetical protein